MTKTARRKPSDGAPGREAPKWTPESRGLPRVVTKEQYEAWAPGAARRAAAMKARSTDWFDPSKYKTDPEVRERMRADVERPVEKGPNRKGWPASARLDTEEAVDSARGFGWPFSLVRPEDMTRLGYPLVLDPPLLLVPSWLRESVRTRFPVFEMRDEDACKNPRSEDLVVVCLHVRRLGARTMVRRNRDCLDLDRLLRRVVDEGVVDAAARVRLDDWLSGLPVNVPQLSREDCDAMDRDLNYEPSSAP